MKDDRLIEQAFEKYCSKNRLECDLWHSDPEVCSAKQQCFENFKQSAKQIRCDSGYGRVPKGTRKRRME